MKDIVERVSTRPYLRGDAALTGGASASSNMPASLHALLE